MDEGWDQENLPQNLFYRSEDDIVLRDGSDLIGAPLEALDPAVFRKAPPLTVWAKGFGGIRNEAGTANYGDYSHLWTGGMAGLDLRGTMSDENDDGLRDTEDDNHWNIGILGGYVQSDLNFASGFKDIQSDFFFAGAYGRVVRDALFLDASIIGGFGGMSEYGPIANNLVPGGIENPGEGYSTDGRFISPSASLGKRFYITDTISFTPEVNATYLAQWIDGSTSPLTLSIEDRFIDTVFGHIQGSVKKVIKRDNSTIIGELRGGLYMSRQLHGDETNLSVVSNQFTIDTSREDVVSPYVGIGATWEIADNFKLSADGEMDFGDLDGGRARFGASLSF
ncbi:MAG: autotransporter outer membrane beta-barrel domain-containing protein [Hyphomicrobiales bacterium]